MSGEDHNHAVAHAATGLVENQTRRRNEGEEAGAGRRVVLGVHPERKRGKRGRKERGGSKVEKKGASHLYPQVLQPCHHAMLLREEWRGGGGCCVHPCACQCVAMSSTASHAIMMSCLCASVFSSQPSLSACLCAFVCAGSMSVRAAGAGAHNQKKRRESACV